MNTKTICGNCRAEIPVEDINVAANTALRRKCGSPWKFSELIEENELPLDLNRPPRGVWLLEKANGFELGISTRSAAACFLIPFMCVWSGFILGSIYGTQIYSGKFNLINSLFGIPFIFGTLILGNEALMSVMGKIVISKDRDQGIIFKGVGPFGWRQQFNWSGVTYIRRINRFRRRGNLYQQIKFCGNKPLRFGQGLNDEKIDFALAFLQQKFREGG